VCAARYLDRRRTRFEHAEEIKAAEGLRDFAAVSDEFEQWVAARSYMTGDGPRAIFADAVGWLGERRVLLPGVTTLARLVARARADGDRRLWETLAADPSESEVVALDGLLEVDMGERISELERARKGPADPTGKSLRLALDRVRDIHRVGVDAQRVRALVPARRLVELARYGLQAKAPHLRRHPRARRTAREVAARIDQGAEVTVDDQGKLRVSALEAIPDPPSLIDLRKIVRAMLARVGLPEVILEGDVVAARVRRVVHVRLRRP